jgi:hypothetical protein
MTAPGRPRPQERTALSQSVIVFVYERVILVIEVDNQELVFPVREDLAQYERNPENEHRQQRRQPVSQDFIRFDKSEFFH